MTYAELIATVLDCIDGKRRIEINLHGRDFKEEIPEELVKEIAKRLSEQLKEEK